MKKYEWNDETIDAFKFESGYISKESLNQRVVDFIDISCQLEDGDCEEEMAKDLMNRIYEL